MNRAERIRALIDGRFDNPYDLLALRLLFPPEHPVVRIDDEIRDLYVYPERLDSSYREEWRRLAVRGLHDHGFADHWESDQDNLERYAEHLARQAIPQCIHEHIDLFRTLGQALAIDQAGNTLRFPDRGRQSVMRLIWPEGNGGEQST